MGWDSGPRGGLAFIRPEDASLIMAGFNKK